MPTTPATGTFDLTFDHTFQTVLITPTQPTETACRKPGAYLTWLSPVGWMYWLFEGPITKQKSVASRGFRRQAGVTIHNQKESGDILLVRTSNLPTQTVEAVATIYESVAIYLLAPDASGKFHQVYVSIDPGTFELHDSRQNVHDLSVILQLPGRRSARA
ncbi:hypothetical protein GCM10028807_32810 [Spirosoma daeguense]